jgi:hypothetical protein
VQDQSGRHTVNWNIKSGTKPQGMDVPSRPLRNLSSVLCGKEAFDRKGRYRRERLKDARGSLFISLEKEDYLTLCF